MTAPDPLYRSESILRRIMTAGIGNLRNSPMMFAMFVLAITLTANFAAGEAGSTGADVYKAKCTLCHGPAGAGTAMGKSLKAADLRSPEVQHKPDAELIQAVSDGKGNMPGFKGTITDDEIHAAIGFVRTLAGKGDSKSKK